MWSKYEGRPVEPLIEGAYSVIGKTEREILGYPVDTKGPVSITSEVTNFRAGVSGPDY